MLARIERRRLQIEALSQSSPFPEKGIGQFTELLEFVFQFSTT